MRLSQIGEFGLIDRLSKIVSSKDKNIVIGVGDDTAAIKFPKNTTVLATTDTLVEDVHFSLKYSSFYQLGWKAMAVNISDIAAMAGTPKFALVTLGLKSKMNVNDIESIYKGMKDVAKKFGVSIIGGDIVKSPKSLFITVDLLGHSDAPIKRIGAKPGDMVMAFGNFGASAAGLRLLQKKKKNSILANAHLMPHPMIKEASSVAKYASSMIDNSDGLARCLHEICDRSKVGAIIDLDSIDVARGASIEEAFIGGEDYNIVFTVPEKLVPKVRGAVVIGEIVKQKGIIIRDTCGCKVKLKAGGFEHF